MNGEDVGMNSALINWLNGIAVNIRSARGGDGTLNPEPTRPIDHDEEEVIGVANADLKEFYDLMIDGGKHRDRVLSSLQSGRSAKEKELYHREMCLSESGYRFSWEFFRMAVVAYFPHFSNARAIKTIAMRRGWLVVCSKNPSDKPSVRRENQPLED